MLLLSTAYLGFAHWVSFSAVTQARAQFTQIGFTPEAICASPIIGFSPVRRVVARDAEGRWMAANYSLLSSRPPKPELREVVESPLFSKALNTPEGQSFHWFTSDYVLPDIEDGELLLIDARYGLFEDMWWSPFVAAANILPDGTLGPLHLKIRRKKPDMRLEFRAGWSAMLGN
jgi:hypothetical protein